jgi:TRAF3-interacting protein 1
MKKTNFPKGLLTDQEMDHKYFEADPHHKLAILQKVIDITRIVMSENFDIKTTNILKGEQPDKTNYFLQMFYKAATNGKDNTPLIQKYLENKASKETKKKAEPEMPSNFGNESKPKFENPTKTEKPKGMIQDDGADVGNEDDNKNDDIKIGGGIGMKMDKRIFVHEDLTESKSEVKKPRVENVDLEAVKEYVQQITKNCNPLGKLVDSLWDDIESMNKELANWINENKKYKDRYDDEMKKSDETLLPLQNELLELEDSIRDEQTQIKAIKSRLIKNEKIIQNLITNVISFKSDQS